MNRSGAEQFMHRTPGGRATLCPSKKAQKKQECIDRPTNHLQRLTWQLFHAALLLGRPSPARRHSNGQAKGALLTADRAEGVQSGRGWLVEPTPGFMSSARLCWRHAGQRKPAVWGALLRAPPPPHPKLHPLTMVYAQYRTREFPVQQRGLCANCVQRCVLCAYPNPGQCPEGRARVLYLTRPACPHEVSCSEADDTRRPGVYWRAAAAVPRVPLLAVRLRLSGYASLPCKGRQSAATEAASGQAHVPH